MPSTASSPASATELPIGSTSTTSATPRRWTAARSCTPRTPLRLYELEDKLAGTEFVRASKQLLANFDHVVAIRPALNARLQLLLDNGESVMVSRQYAPTIKRKLDL